MKIPLSQISNITSFKSAVETHAQNVRDWNKHMQQVDADKKANVPVAKRHVPFPAPVAHPLISGSVDENGVISYETYDDGPTPAEKLAKFKSACSLAAIQAAQEATEKVDPVNLRLANALRVQDISVADTGRQKNPTFIDKVKSLVFGDAMKQVRSASDNEFLQQHNDRQARVMVIQRTLAATLVDVENITGVTSWQPPKFGE